MQATIAEAWAWGCSSRPQRWFVFFVGGVCVFGQYNLISIHMAGLDDETKKEMKSTKAIVIYSMVAALLILGVAFAIKYRLHKDD